MAPQAEVDAALARCAAAGITAPTREDVVLAAMQNALEQYRAALDAWMAAPTADA